MNKVTLAHRMAKRFGFLNREAAVIVDTLIRNLARALQEGRKVEIRGLGTFGTKQRKASMGRAVKTGRPVPVPSLRRVFFRPGQALKEIKTPKEIHGA
jgi:integration host factor subunit beta